jgi:hypothetical protein
MYRIFNYKNSGGIKIFKALARLASNSKFYSPNQRKTRQNHVFAEHFVCTSPTRKIYHPDCVCVCVIIKSKSPCQVCVCISELGRNKTQLAGKKDSLRGRKKHSPSWQVSVKNYSPIPNSTRIWRVGEWLFPPLIRTRTTTSLQQIPLAVVVLV